MRALLKICTLLLAVGLGACVSTSDKPDLTNRKLAAKDNAALAAAYLQKGKLAAANEIVNKALKQDPKSVEAHNTYAMLLVELGENAKAERFYRRAIELNPENASAVRNNYGVFLCAQHRNQEGIAQFKRALLDPLYATPEYAYAHAGACFMDIPDFAQAETYLRKALLRDKNMQLALYQMARLNYLQQRYPLAVSYLERYFKNYKKSPPSLWLAIRLAWQLGDKQAANNYALILRNQYPDSLETQKLIQTEAARKR